jgi:hypothetical protein
MRPGRRVILLCVLLLALACTALARAEVVQRGGLRVSFLGKLSPRVLPREGSAPISVFVGGRIAGTGGSSPPPLRQITIAINRNGHLDYRGLPTCRLEQIQPSTNQGALAACRTSLVGEGSFTAKIALPEQAPFPSSGKMLAFNGVLRGRPVLLAHVFGTDPVPSSFTLVFEIGAAKGTYGTVLRASLPDVTGNAGYITALSMELGRSFTSRGERHSYLSAGCPAPRGFPGAVFPFARVSFGFGKKVLTSVLIRNCGARGR